MFRDSAAMIPALGAEVSFGSSAISGLVSSPALSHGLRRRLHYFAALRLERSAHSLDFVGILGVSWNRAAKRRQNTARGVSPGKKGLFGKPLQGRKKF